MFKNMRLPILFDVPVDPTFKMLTGFVNIARTSASTSNFIYWKRFPIIRNCVFI